MLFKDKFVLSYQNIKSNISLEPVIVLFVFCNFLANGAQQNNNILFKKICTDKLSYNVSICSDHQKHPAFHLQVLVRKSHKNLPAWVSLVVAGVQDGYWISLKPLCLITI